MKAALTAALNKFRKYDNNNNLHASSIDEAYKINNKSFKYNYSYFKYNQSYFKYQS